MTIWLLALILFVSLAGIGYRQGAIRVGFSLIGIFFAALLAVPLAKLVTPALKAVGVANPMWLWALAPFVVFVIVLSVFKIAGLAVHKKVDVYYKYKAGDLRLALFERINARLGLCLGVVNGLAYLILISVVVQIFSYWTLRLASSDEDPRAIRWTNQLGRDLNSTGMNKVAGAINSLSESYYDAADNAALILLNPLLEARLSRYPAFISLGLKPEFQTLGADAEFATLRLQKKPIKEIWHHPTVAPIVNNPDMLREIWNTAKPDLLDLNIFLHEGKSAKYDSEEILGRWTFAPASTMLALRREKPKLPQTELIRFKRLFVDRFSRATLIAAPNHQLVLKNIPSMKLPQPGSQPSTELQTFDGKWNKSGGEYEMSISGADAKPIKIDGGRLTVSIEGLTVVFEKED